VIISSANTIQSQGETVENITVVQLPSEETYQKIEQASGVPNLRAKPPGVEGNPQGQVPVGEPHYLMICLLGLAFVSYKYIRGIFLKSNNQNIKIRI